MEPATVQKEKKKERKKKEKKRKKWIIKIPDWKNFLSVTATGGFKSNTTIFLCRICLVLKKMQFHFNSS